MDEGDLGRKMKAENERAVGENGGSGTRADDMITEREEYEEVDGGAYEEIEARWTGARKGKRRARS